MEREQAVRFLEALHNRLQLGGMSADFALGTSNLLQQATEALKQPPQQQQAPPPPPQAPPPPPPPVWSPQPPQPPQQQHGTPPPGTGQREAEQNPDTWFQGR